MASVVSDSVRPHRRQPTRLCCPWDSLGKNTGVGCHFLLQCLKLKSESEVAQSCPTLSDPMNCSPPGSFIHGVFQARVLEWGAIAFSVSFNTTPQFSKWWFLKVWYNIELKFLSMTFCTLTLKFISLGVFSNHQLLDSPDTNWMSYNSILTPPRVTIRLHRFNKAAPTAAAAASLSRVWLCMTP